MTSATTMAKEIQYVIWRGRFQPFTKTHYETIKGFYYTSFPNLTINAADRHLILCVIRVLKYVQEAIEILSEFENTVKSDFRHLRIFNPMSSAECLLEIQRGLTYHVKQDEEFIDPDDKHSFCDFLTTNVTALSSPVEFLNLVEVLSREPTHAPLRGEARTDPREQQSRFASDLISGSLKIDSFTNLHWFMPIFDSEDSDCCHDLVARGVEPNKIHPAVHPDLASAVGAGDNEEPGPLCYTLQSDECLKSIGRISYYSAFLCYCYLSHMQLSYTQHFNDNQAGNRKGILWPVNQDIKKKESGAAFLKEISKELRLLETYMEEQMGTTLWSVFKKKYQDNLDSFVKYSKQSFIDNECPYSNEEQRYLERTVEFRKLARISLRLADRHVLNDIRRSATVLNLGTRFTMVRDVINFDQLTNARKHIEAQNQMAPDEGFAQNQVYIRAILQALDFGLQAYSTIMNKTLNEEQENIINTIKSRPDGRHIGDYRIADTLRALFGAPPIQR